MHAQEWDREHDPEREGHALRQDHDEAAPVARVPEGADTADASRVFHAAATGRADVVGTRGMGALQRAVGNSAVGAVLQRQVLQRQESRGEELQRQEEAERSPVHDVISSGGGQPLDTDTRTDMERRMGADFSDVRVHTDSAAHESAKGVGAHAYTVGSDVVFQRDAYDPSSPQGRTTLAHELTHVIQQRNGPVEGTAAPGGIRVSDPSDRFEREAVANADRVLADPAPAPAPESAPATDTASTPAPVAAPASASQPAVQRAATEDEDEEPADVQGSFVQRAAEEGSEKEKEKEEDEEASSA
ncbi:eCIS core domain-containing protein [Streptomyces sp. CB01580]|uniref:eCIS core domain-containing protein n=1 Tax=Streptomyces sp. CB01580 TaxID=1703933 RepID=UPI0009A0CDE9|nr:DUF4157 domain-containing protein [Streptomyces sp. CB01580]